jgi:hypothetical protein
LAKRTHGGRKLWALSLPNEPEAVRFPGLWNSLSTGTPIWPLNLRLKNHCKFSVVYNDRYFCTTVDCETER